MARQAVACLWMGADLPSFSACRYGERDVTALRRGLKRHVTDPELLVLVDEKFAHLGKQFEYEHLGGWSCRMEAFAPENAPPPGERYVMFDLDQILVGPCDWLWEWDEAPVGLCLDPNSDHIPCSTVISYDHIGAKMLWDAYQKAEKGDYTFRYSKGLFSEMGLIRDVALEYGWPFLEREPARLLSYKIHIRRKRMSWDHASVVYCHGDPKPDMLPPALKARWTQ